METGKFQINAVIFDARGNGGGIISPTITGDHQNRITDYTAIVIETYGEEADHTDGEKIVCETTKE